MLDDAISFLIEKSTLSNRTQAAFYQEMLNYWSQVKKPLNNTFSMLPCKNKKIAFQADNTASENFIQYILYEEIAHGLLVAYQLIHLKDTEEFILQHTHITKELMTQLSFVNSWQKNLMTFELTSTLINDIIGIFGGIHRPKSRYIHKYFFVENDSIQAGNIVVCPRKKYLSEDSNLPLLERYKLILLQPLQGEIIYTSLLTISCKQSSAEAAYFIHYKKSLPYHKKKVKVLTAKQAKANSLYLADVDVQKQEKLRAILSQGNEDKEIKPVHFLFDHVYQILMIISPFIEGRTLKEYVQFLLQANVVGNNNIQISLISALFKAITQPVYQGWSSQDLKPENIIVTFTANNRISGIRIIDHETGQIIDSEKTRSTYPGTVPWTPPDFFTEINIEKRDYYTSLLIAAFCLCPNEINSLMYEKVITAYRRLFDFNNCIDANKYSEAYNLTLYIKNIIISILANRSLAEEDNMLRRYSLVLKDALMHDYWPYKALAIRFLFESKNSREVLFNFLIESINSSQILESVIDDFLNYLYLSRSLPIKRYIAHQLVELEGMKLLLFITKVTLINDKSTLLPPEKPIAERLFFEIKLVISLLEKHLHPKTVYNPGTFFSLYESLAPYDLLSLIKKVKSLYADETPEAWAMKGRFVNLMLRLISPAQGEKITLADFQNLFKPPAIVEDDNLLEYVQALPSMHCLPSMAELSRKLGAARN